MISFLPGQLEPRNNTTRATMAVVSRALSIRTSFCRLLRPLFLHHLQKFIHQTPVSQKSRNFSGATIPFISLQFRGYEPSNFAILLVFLTLKTCWKISFSKQLDCSLATGFPGPEKFSGLSRNRPHALVVQSLNIAIQDLDTSPVHWISNTNRIELCVAWYHFPFDGWTLATAILPILPLFIFSGLIV